MLIGLATLFTLWALGRLAGISQIVHRTLRGPDADEAWADWLWRPGFVLGLIAGGWAWHQWGPAGHAEAVAASPAPLWTLIVGGPEFGSLTLTRLYTLHVVVLPVSATLLLVMPIGSPLSRRARARRLCAAPVVIPTSWAPCAVPAIRLSASSATLLPMWVLPPFPSRWPPRTWWPTRSGSSAT